MAATLFDKLWDIHHVAGRGGGNALILIDRALLHERIGGVALESLAAVGRKLERRQGLGVRSHLAFAETFAASDIANRITDFRTLKAAT